MNALKASNAKTVIEEELVIKVNIFIAIPRALSFCCKMTVYKAPSSNN